MDMWPGRGRGGPRNIFQYICQLHVTDKYSFIFLGTEEYIVIYLPRYIPRCIHRLTEKYKLYYSV
jgi:hypothetical protein